MKAVLLSIKPEYCELIANGKKTIEVRKNRPKLDTPFKVYVYETKTPLRWNKAHNDIIGGRGGYVIGEFVCDEITEYPYETFNDGEHFMPYGELEKTCLDGWELYDYLGTKDGYGWHISDLIIYDTPKLLHHFFKPCDGCDKIGTKRCTEELTDCRAKVITRPPQSWCYVESEVQEDE